MAKIKLDYLTLGIADLITRLRGISAALNGNAAFAALAPKLPAFDAAIDTLEASSAAYEATVALARQQLTVRDEARAAAEELARGLASAAEGETSDAAVLQSGSWLLRGVAAPVGPLPAPQNLSATGGDMEGQADLGWQPVSGRDTYLAEQAPAATGPWTQFYVGKKSSCTATGLTSGSSYWFRVRAIGTAGPGPWSDPAQTRAT
jgi:hypothetical protein